MSPDESGEICLLACMPGRSGEIWFPELQSGQTLTFAEIATAFLADRGYCAVECAGEEEARGMAARRSGGSPEWPVYYFGSDTTGEKAYEEFFTADEQVDLTSHHAPGVILNASLRSISGIDATLSAPAARFDAAGTTKADIVETMKSFLGNFTHEEKERNPDSKM